MFALAGGSTAQTADTTEIELSELSVTGEARGRSLNSDLYGRGGASGPVPGYVATRSTVGTKTDTPILETAQSVSVVGRKQIEDQNALTINQALRYTPSVTTEQRGGAGSTRLEQFYIRGFSAPVFLDGMALIGGRDANATVDPYRLERVDIIKGPASVLYGQAGPGGLVNLVSKVPQFTRFGEVFLQGGSYSTARAGFDVGGPIESDIPGLADQFAYRVIGLGWNADGPAVTTRIERALINPSITWRPSTDTSFTLIGNYQRDPYSGFYGGVPSVGSVFPRNFGNGRIGYLPADFYDGNRTIERSDRTQASLEYLLDHRFNENLRFHSAGRYLRTQGDYRSVYSSFSTLNGPFANGPTIARQIGGTNVAAEAYTMDNSFVANFDTGFIAHTALLGVDHRTFSTRTTSGPFLNTMSLNVLAPNYDELLAFPAFNTTSRITAQQTGVYFQDQAKFDRLVLTLGGRYDVARQSGPTRNFANRTLTLQDVPADAFTGRASLLYLFDSGVAPYVSYSQAFEPIVNGRIFDPAFGTAGRIPDPVSSDQYEAGIKYQPPGTDILLTAAAFDIRQSNNTTTDTRNPGFVLQNGEVGVQGVEFEARANLSEGLTLIGGFSLLDIRNTRTTATTTNDLTGLTNVSLQGLRPVQVPDTTAALFVDYHFTGGPLLGAGIGGGVRYLGPSWGDPANTFQVPESVLVDLFASYNFKHLDPRLQGFDLQVNVQNLLDERYVTGCFGYSGCYYGLPRTVYATLRYRW
ncbi:TonB-dependent siderophore receptor [Methylobacterium sp. J-067]|uniref:TonB-dependent siderophore receptor n=1 Tax=Methylobacterium sp. J-067 TaxID=2836648 RepID=UPI001FBAED35|nr:TonB-dependent siderophore receptor [Methylobacterium sp. J-067]MCJ2024476.1 TonB-dependent siderophore receptor [Methylobacterium sp. J-067]